MTTHAIAGKFSEEDEATGGTVPRSDRERVPPEYDGARTPNRCRILAGLKFAKEVLAPKLNSLAQTQRTSRPSYESWCNVRHVIERIKIGAGASLNTKPVARAELR
jgi:hypothetical protein